MHRRRLPSSVSLQNRDTIVILGQYYRDCMVCVTDSNPCHKISVFAFFLALFVLCHCCPAYTQVIVQSYQHWAYMPAPICYLDREQWRVGTGQIILKRHMQGGFRQQRNLPLLTDVTTTGEAGSRQPNLGWHIYSKHTQIPSIGGGGGAERARHAIETQRRNGDEPPQCEAEEVGCSWTSTAQPWGENMKRKSERRRAESRKKRCAAHNSSEAAPNSDIYIEITGKKGLQGWTRSTLSLVGNMCRRTRADCACTSLLFYLFIIFFLISRVCESLWLFLQLLT